MTDNNEQLINKINELQLKLDAESKEKSELSDKIRNLEYIMAHMPGNIYWKNIDNRYEYCNDNNAKMLNMSHRDDIKGKTLFDIMSPEYATRAQENDDTVIAEGRHISFEEIGYDHESGQKIVYLTKKAPLRDSDNNIIGIFGLAVDITERKKMEAELEAAKSEAEMASLAKSDFISNMSHDLRTPFSGILGFTHQLYANETDLTKKKKLGYIIDSAESLLDLLNDILEASRNGSKHQYIMSTFDVLALLRQIRLLFSAEVERKHLSFSVDHDAESLIVTSDKHRLHRILINLISNAIKFTDQGAITVTVSMTQQKHEHWLQLKIADTGSGIAESDFANIFERFTRLSSSHQGMFTGTGIGLWLVKTFVDELGGNIEVTSKPGDGSTFTCNIPVKVNESTMVKSDVTSSVDHQLERSVKIHKKRATELKHILMVEDHELTALAQRCILESFGYHVDVASNATLACALAMQQSYDLIIMDIGLPDMNGFDAASKIRKSCALNQTTPILGLTAHLNQSEKQQLHDSAVDKLMVKPLRQSACQLLADWLA